MDSYQCIAPDVKLGRDVKLSKFINLYGCEVGDETKIGAFVEIQKNAKIGKRCKISSHTFICEGVTIEDNVFIGHGVTFINDSYPHATTTAGDLQTEADWKVEHTVIKRGLQSAPGQPFYRTPSSARTRWWEQAVLSPRMCRPIALWLEIPHEFYVTSSRLWRLQNERQSCSISRPGYSAPRT